MLRAMADNVSQGKALALDGIDSRLFELGKDCQHSMCDTCQQKLSILRSLIREEYWGTAASDRHLRSRLICLNKVFPRRP